MEKCHSCLQKEVLREKKSLISVGVKRDSFPKGNKKNLAKIKRKTNVTRKRRKKINDVFK